MTRSCINPKCPEELDMELYADAEEHSLSDEPEDFELPGESQLYEDYEDDTEDERLLADLVDGSIPEFSKLEIKRLCSLWENI